jgi:hypothetical protein
VKGHSEGCGGRLVVRGGYPHRRDARGRAGGAVPWSEEAGAGDTVMAEVDGGSAQGRSRTKSTRAATMAAPGAVARAHERGGPAHRWQPQQAERGTQ